ncbi:MAG: 2'-5' RNA ligase family protein [Gemmatimonadaceae bacterium]
MNSGIFVVSELTGSVREQVAAVQRACDPRLARSTPPHITIAGSSGVGPIPIATPVSRLRELVGSIVADTPPITVRFGAPMRFMQTDIVVLPLDPHGPLRTLHERIARSGLSFERSRFPFAPHCTLSFYPTLTPELRRTLFAARVEEPVVIDRLQFFATVNPQPGRKVLELVLGESRRGA